MEPVDHNKTAVIMEFKVFDPDEESELADIARRALQQIEEKQYDADLISKGIAKERIYKYGFAFRGKECLIVRG